MGLIDALVRFTINSPNTETQADNLAETEQVLTRRLPGEIKVTAKVDLGHPQPVETEITVFGRPVHSSKTEAPAIIVTRQHEVFIDTFEAHTNPRGQKVYRVTTQHETDRQQAVQAAKNINPNTLDLTKVRFRR